MLRQPEPNVNEGNFGCRPGPVRYTAVLHGTWTGEPETGLKTGAILRLIASFGFVFLAAAVGGSATSRSVSGWYEKLAKPGFNPPDWLFGPAWTVLYLLMALAAFLVWNRGFSAPGVRLALALFLVQLVLNALWSVFFFGMRSPRLGLADIIPLWLAILATTVLFFRVSRAAGWLLVPYLAWVGFAAALNIAILRLNPRP
jgi:benzodiazapine receptor